MIMRKTLTHFTIKAVLGCLVSAGKGNERGRREAGHIHTRRLVGRRAEVGRAGPGYQ